MSKYTTELRYLHSQGFVFGLDTYPIFDPAYRTALNKKILDHYKYREIGSETPARFKHYLNTKMAEIMPLYNKMYSSELLAFNPLYNADYTETSTKTTTGSSEADTALDTDRNATGSQENTNTRNLSTDGTNGNTNTRNLTDTDAETIDLFSVDSDTPGGMISVGDIKGFTWASKANQQENAKVDTKHQTGTSIDAGSTSQHDTGTSIDVGTNAQHEVATNVGNTTATISNLDDYVKRIVGNTGNKNYAEMVLDFRATFLNIDMLVINDLNELFMGVY